MLRWCKVSVVLICNINLRGYSARVSQPNLTRCTVMVSMQSSSIYRRRLHARARVFNVTVILIHDTANYVSMHGLHYLPVMWSMKRRGSAIVRAMHSIHNRLLQLINGVKLPAVADSLLQGPKRRNLPDLNPSCWGHACLPCSMKATFSLPVLIFHIPKGKVFDQNFILKTYAYLILRSNSIKLTF